MDREISDGKNEIQNVYALNVKGEDIHISDAHSGRQGYFCRGCLREMQAVKPAKINYVHYFRHDAKAVAGQPKCTNSDETYRHKIGKEILQRIKRLKVPDVYKYPPRGHAGLPNLLVKSQFIEAHYVQNELTFYENEFSEICFGNDKNVSIDERYLTVRPDLTFFNHKDEPILFIEIIATHGIKPDKLAKLKRLGIDTVQVIIGK